MAICIKVWARIPGPHAMEALHGWAWLKSWPPPGILSWSTRGFRIAGFFLLLLLAAVVMDRLAGLKPLRRSTLVEGALCYGLGTVLVATLFWFLTAPDFRFAIGILATLPALVVVWPAWRLASGMGLTRFFLDGRVMLAIMLFLALASLKGNWRVAALSASTWTTLPRPAATAIALGPHFSAVIPSDPGDPSCWDTPIPCVPGKPAASLGWGRILIWRAIEILPPPRP
jgi:hypothetical protein